MIMNIKQYKVLSLLVIMDLYAATNAMVVAIQHAAARQLVRGWQQSAERDNWYDPSSSTWKYPRCELPIVINEVGEEVSADDQRKAWWNKLVRDSNLNLSDEDAAASRIIAAMKGHHARQWSRETYRVQLLSDRENYRFNECHGGC